MTAYRIDYSDDTGSGDYDPMEYATQAEAEQEAQTRLASNDMPWAKTARVFPIDDDGEPLEEALGSTTFFKRG